MKKTFKLSDIDTSKWKEFYLKGLFKISKCKGCSKSKLIEGNIPYVARSAENNGITEYCGNKNFINKGNSISIHSEWKETYCSFYQDKDFVSDGMIAMIQNHNLNEWNALFICTILNLTKYNGKGLLNSLNDVTISLPVDSNGQPDWEYMEKTIKELEKTIKEELLKTIPQLSDIDTSEWKEFKVSDIFINKNVKKYSKSPKEEGLIPFVTSTSTNNGISCYCNLENVCKGNCITVSTNGRCFDCFYQPINFAVSSDCEVLYPREEYEHFLNEYNAIFITTILSLNRSKYGYSNKPKNGIVWKTVISLPVDSNGQPDWEYMEKYIKNEL